MEKCATCRGHVLIKHFQCYHPEHRETTYRDCLKCGDYAPPRDGEFRWVTVVLARSGDPVAISRTLNALEENGWNDVIVFRQSSSGEANAFGRDGPSTAVVDLGDGDRLTMWQWRHLCMAAALHKRPNASDFLIVESSGGLPPSLRERIECANRTQERVGFIYLDVTHRKHGQEAEPAEAIIAAPVPPLWPETVIIPAVAMRSLLSWPRAFLGQQFESNVSDGQLLTEWLVARHLTSHAIVFDI